MAERSSAKQCLLCRAVCRCYMPQSNICSPEVCMRKPRVSEDFPTLLQWQNKKVSVWQWAYSEVSQMWPLIMSMVSPTVYTSPLKVIQDECYYLLNTLSKTQANRNILGNKIKYCCIYWKGMERNIYSKKFKNFHIYNLEAESFLSTVKPWCDLFIERRCTLLEEKLYPLY